VLRENVVFLFRFYSIELLEISPRVDWVLTFLEAECRGFHLRVKGVLLLVALMAFLLRLKLRLSPLQAPEMISRLCTRERRVNLLASEK